MPPDNVKGAPRAAEPGKRRHHIAAAAKQGESALSVTRRPVRARRQRAAERREAALTCRVSLLVPSGRRTRWWYLATCPACGAPHLGRAGELADVTGTRRLPCHHWVTIVVARTYGRAEAAA
jgi:hypothetical protein